jgi:RNA polymerase sigma factor (sigma-70 family)
VAVHSLEDARDRELVGRVRGGEEEAYRQLFRKYGPMAKALALRVARQPFMAEEIVQEAFLVLWRNPASFREERGSFRAWLMAMVHHRAVDTVRREEAQRRRSLEAHPGDLVGEDVAEGVVHAADSLQQGSRVRRALWDLPPEQRQVLELMYFQGKTQASISRELGVPLGTVKSRTLLGMRRLRSLLWREEE